MLSAWAAGPATALLQTIAQTLPPNAVVVDETVSSGLGMRSLLRSDDAQSYFGLRGGGIGWGLPARPTASMRRFSSSTVVSKGSPVVEGGAS